MKILTLAKFDELVLELADQLHPIEFVETIRESFEEAPTLTLRAPNQSQATAQMEEDLAGKVFMIVVEPNEVTEDPPVKSDRAYSSNLPCPNCNESRTDWTVFSNNRDAGTSTTRFFCNACGHHWEATK